MASTREKLKKRNASAKTARRGRCRRWWVRDSGSHSNDGLIASRSTCLPGKRHVHGLSLHLTQQCQRRRVRVHAECVYLIKQRGKGNGGASWGHDTRRDRQTSPKRWPTNGAHRFFPRRGAHIRRVPLWAESNRDVPLAGVRCAR